MCGSRVILEDPSSSPVLITDPNSHEVVMVIPILPVPDSTMALHREDWDPCGSRVALAYVMLIISTPLFNLPGKTKGNPKVKGKKDPNFSNLG